jgi:UrcA family protein
MIVNTVRKKLYTAVCMLLGSAAVGAPWTSAQAGEQTDPRVVTQTVRFADLNIHTAEGAEVLYHRIRAAAEQVCLPPDHYSMLRKALPQCVDKAIDEAVKKVDAPYLTALRFGNGNVRLASK